jgi:hypothetical protein
MLSKLLEVLNVIPAGHVQVTFYSNYRSITAAAVNLTYDDLYIFLLI